MSYHLTTRWYMWSSVDPVELVFSTFSGRAYHCRTVEEVDAHLTELTRQRTSRNITDLVRARIRTDIDRLLERRAWLEATATPHREAA